MKPPESKSMGWRRISSLVSILRMLTVALLLLGRLHAFKQQENASEIYEIRIYENAPPGTKATLNEAFDRVLRELKNCFAQLDSEVDWIEFDSPLLVFLTTREVPSSAASMQYATLHLMCASNMMRSITFSLHVTRRNRHPPRFSEDHYKFYAPVTLGHGLEVGVVKVLDSDPIIYNSQFQLNLVPFTTGSTTHSHWAIFKNGSLNVRNPMTDLPLYKPVDFKVVAYDFGSPQLFSIAKISVIPVSVSPPKNLRVNVANEDYQIFEWDTPSYGVPEKIRVEIARNGEILHMLEVDGEETVAMSKTKFQSGPDYSVRAIAIDLEGSTPSESNQFVLLNNDLTCRGRCADGGKPMCYFGRTHKLEQYRDVNGLHCLCFEGFSGAQCDSVERCDGERSVEIYGGVNWQPTYVNQSGTVPCPYNADNAKLERRCIWDREGRVAKWEDVSTNDVCKKQSAILVHLGVLANYVQRPDTTASGFAAVQRFLSSILKFPSFDLNVTTVQFDEKIAEHTAQVLDAMLSRDLRSLPGNVTHSRQQLVGFVSEFVHRLPTPYTLESVTGGLQMRSQQWVSGADSFPTPMSNRCYVHLPKALRTAIVNFVCVKNNTIYDVPEATTTTDVPALLIESQDSNDPLILPSGTRALIALRPPNTHGYYGRPLNYTCAFYDHKENGWSVAGITVLSRNFENGMILCETTHLSLFTLLPEHLFEANSDLTIMLVNLLPIISSFLIFIVSLFLLFVVLFQRKIDPALPLFLLSIAAVHGTHLFILTLPNFFSIRHLDPYLYLLLQCSLLASAALMGLLNSSLYSRVVELELDYRESSHVCTRLILVIFFAILIPGASCSFTWFYNGQIFSGIVGKAPQLMPINLTFIFCFLVPFVLYLGIALGYGGYALHYGRRLIRRARLGEIKNGLLSDLNQASGSSIFLLFAYYGESFLFFERSGFFKNLSFAALQLLTTLLLFVYVGYLCRVHTRFRHVATALSQSNNNDEVASAATSSTGVAYRNISAHSHDQLGKDDRLIDHHVGEQNGVGSGSDESASSIPSSPDNTLVYSSQRAPIHGIVTELGPAGYRTSAVMRQELGRYQKGRQGVSFEPNIAGSREPSFIDEPSSSTKRGGQPLVSIV
ncbi:hypothetical protein M3Y94_01201000 [Aphelenchoides besseyi]|nr:hypothetical protein M3Y94_01201000 [Aphelenchoides besseyi]KAI6228431.1 hypothetical protein M3Y95_00621500 [Aphelenchoides besseyi]